MNEVPALVRTRRDLSQIVNISADFLGNICAAFCLQILSGLSYFYLGFDFFSDIKRYSILVVNQFTFFAYELVRLFPMQICLFFWV